MIVDIFDRIDNKNYKSPFIDSINNKIVEFLSKIEESELIDAIKYSVISPGKKIRSILLMELASYYKADMDQALILSVVVEFIHSYSLIHDDLPSMDNDDYRRGKLSCHKKFGESTAILAGVSLLSYSFEIIAKEFYQTPEIANKLIYNLAKINGTRGLAYGQFLDLHYENKRVDQDKIEEMNKHKTGALFSFVTKSVGIISNLDEKELLKLDHLGYLYGLKFQIEDDLLDILGDEKLAGKKLNKDQKAGKNTIPNLLGVKRSNELIDEIRREILANYTKSHQ